MNEASESLHACVREMRREADSLEQRAASLQIDTGLGWMAGAAQESQMRLAGAVTDLVALRREAADLLSHAAYTVEPVSSWDGYATRSMGMVSAMAGYGAVGAFTPHLDAIARDLTAMASPQILEVTRNPTLPVLGLTLLAASTVIGGYLYWRAGRDVLGPAPVVRPLGEDAAAGSEWAAESLGASRPASVSELITGCGYVDALGQQERAVVDIAKITTATGEESWVVTLPSTKDWVVFDGDTPAPNDLDAILALALFPGGASTFARGIEEAVRQAGIPAGAPVLLVGFSLGGMIAADLGRAGIGTPSVRGVIAAGAPIDTAADPAGVPVLSIVHDGDMVPTLDFAPDGDGPLRVTVTDSVAEGVQAHSSTAYAATAEAHDQGGVLSAPFAQFLVSDESTQITHTQYQIVEAGMEAQLSRE